MVFDDDDFDNNNNFTDDDNPPTDECDSGPPSLQAKIVSKLKRECDDEEDVDE